MKGQCRLCLKFAELQVSHIIPKFVINWLKESSPGYIRTSNNPNKRIQDGYKQYYLCWDCEQLFSGWEKSFSEFIFSPLHSNPPSTESIKYQTWLLKFAVSITWRVFLYCSDLGLAHLTTEQKAIAKRAEKVWRKFLMGRLQNPEQFAQHLLPLDVVNSSHLFNNSPFINRYLLSTVDMAVVSWKTSPVLVYAKLGRLLLFGIIEDENGGAFKGTKIQNKGILKQPTNYAISSLVLNHIGERADKTNTAASTISPKQQDKIEQMVNENLDKVKTSEFVRGLKYDRAIASGNTSSPNSIDNNE